MTHLILHQSLKDNICMYRELDESYDINEGKLVVSKLKGNEFLNLQRFLTSFPEYINASLSTYAYETDSGTKYIVFDKHKAIIDITDYDMN